MHRLFRFKYPKITLLALIVVATYVVFQQPFLDGGLPGASEWSYLGAFFAGLLFSFGFTTPIAVAVFLVLDPSSIIGAALAGGAGAVIADMTIFKLIKISFMDEFIELKKNMHLPHLVHHFIPTIPRIIKTYTLYAVAGLVIASPLPDEIGVAMLAGLSHIKAGALAIVSFVFNTLGILIILLIGA